MRILFGILLVASYIIIAPLALARDYVVDSPTSMLTRTDEIKSVNEAVQDMIITVGTWQAFFDSLNSKNEVTILWHGYGGWNGVQDYIVNVLQMIQKEKQVTIIAVGYSASAHANTLCEIDNVKFSSSAVLMFHDAIDIDGELAKDPSMFTACVAKGILTSEDVEAIMQGMEVWIIYGKETKEVRYIPDRRLKETQ